MTYTPDYSGWLVDWPSSEAYLDGHPTYALDGYTTPGAGWTFGDQKDADGYYRYVEGGVPSNRVRKALAVAQAGPEVEAIRTKLRTVASSRRRVRRGEDGAEIDADRWAMGEADYWRRWVRETGLKPTVRIGLEFAKHCGHDSDAWIPLAAKLTAVIDELSRKGRRVEVYGLDTRNWHGEAPVHSRNRTVFRWPILGPGERPDPDRLMAWASASGVLRCTGFERANEWWRAHGRDRAPYSQGSVGDWDGAEVRTVLGMDYYLGGNGDRALAAAIEDITRNG